MAIKLEKVVQTYYEALEEGSRFNAVVRGINKKKRKELEGKLPVNVRAAIFQRAGGYKTVVFDLDEE